MSIIIIIILFHSEENQFVQFLQIPSKYVLNLFTGSVNVVVDMLIPSTMVVILLIKTVVVTFVWCISPPKSKSVK